MRRRDFIALLGGAAASWPQVARAQQERVRRIVIMVPNAESDPQMQAHVAAFRQGLQELGWTEGRNIRFDYRWLASDVERAKAYAAELAGLAPDLVMVGTRAAAVLAAQASRSIPIVFANLADPVSSGLVQSLARPGGNITGFAAFEFAITGKWLSLLKEMVPSIKRVLFLHNSRTGPYIVNYMRTLESAAPSYAVRAVAAEVSNAAEIERAIDEFAREPNGGLLCAPEPTVINNFKLIIAMAARHRLPALYPFRYCAVDGGLAGYGFDQADQYRRAAGYADRILKGAKPADLPVQAPTKFDFVLNLKTAKALGIVIPQTILVSANEVIE